MSTEIKREKKRSFLGIEVDTLSWWGLLIAASSAAIALSAYVWWFGLLSLLHSSGNGQGWANFGSYFGGVVGPFIGFASIVLLVATLHSQRTELHEQRTLTKLQSIEQSLFSWLRSYKEQLAEIEDVSSGRCRLYAIRRWYEERFSGLTVSRIYRVDDVGQQVPEWDNLAFPDYLTLFEGVEKGNEIAQSVLDARLQSAMNGFNEIAHESHRDVFESLFRSLYRLFLWIDESNITNEQKWHYTSLVRAQLSWVELVYLTYNGLTKHGAKFASLINKYALLDNLTPDRNDLLWAFNWIFPNLPPSLPGDPSEPYKSHWPYSLAAFDSDLAKEKLGIVKRLS